MVFENRILEYVNDFLKAYFEDTEEKQLKLAFLSGEVILTGLVLKQTALDDLKLPVKTIHGRVNEIVLNLNWRTLFSEPVTIRARGVYLLVLSEYEFSYDPIEERRRLLEIKRKIVAKLEDDWKKKQAQERSTEKVNEKQERSVKEKLAAAFIKNVQFKISDIHIRYEDKVASPERPFSMGITIKSINGYTADQSWKRVDEDLDSMPIHCYKQVELDSLCVYINSNTELFSKKHSSQLDESFYDSIHNSMNENIIGPVNLKIRAELNMTPEENEVPYSKPKIRIETDVEHLSVTLEKQQYRNLLNLNDEFDRLTKEMIIRRYRPNAKKCKGNYKIWWKFAYEYILNEHIRKRLRLSWKIISEHLKKCKDYLRCLLKIANYTENNMHIPKEDLDDLDYFEETLDSHNIMITREYFRAAMKKEHENRGWRQVLPWARNNFTDINIGRRFSQLVTDEDRKQLSELIDLNESIQPASYPITFIENVMDFYLKNIEIRFKDNCLEQSDVITIDLDTVHLSYNNRPSHHAFQLIVDIKNLDVYGMKQNNIVPKLVSKESSNKLDEKLPLFFVEYETNPLDSKFKQDNRRIFIRGQPLRFLYDIQTIRNIMEFFKAPDEFLLKIRTIATDTLKDFQKYTRSQFEEIVNKSERVDLDVDIKSSYCIVPYQGFYNPLTGGSEVLLIVNFGQLTASTIINSCEQQLNQSSGSKTFDAFEIALKAYDNFEILLKNVQVMLALKSENWMYYMNENKKSDMHILLPTSLSILCNKNCLTTETDLPKFKISAKLPSLILDLCDERLLKLVTLLESLSVSETEETEILESIDLEGSVDSLHRKRSKSSIANYFDFLLIENPPLRLKKKMIQKTNFVTNFVMDECQINIFGTSENKLILKFSLRTLTLNSIHRNYDSNYELKVKEIELVQYRNKPFNDIIIIQTPSVGEEDEYLLKIDYKAINKSSPEFNTLENSKCQNHVKMELNKIFFVAHCEAIHELYVLFNQFQTNLQSFREKNAHKKHRHIRHIKIHELPIIYEDQPLIETSDIFYDVTMTTIPIMKKSLKKDSIIYLRLNLLLSQVEFHITSEICDLINLRMQGANFQTIFQKTRLFLTAELDNFLLSDLNPNTLYKEIMYVESGKVFKIKLTQFFHENDAKLNLNDVHYDIEMNIGCIRFIYLNLFITKFFYYVNMFSNTMNAIVNMSHEAAENAKHNIQSVYKNDFKVRFQIDLHAPNILVPLNTTEPNVMVFKLGQFIIRNEFVNVFENYENIYDNIVLEMTDMRLFEALMISGQTDYNLTNNIIEPVTFILNLKRKLIEYDENIPSFEFSAHLDTINVLLYNKTFVNLGRILNENFQEYFQEEQPIKKKIGKKINKRHMNNIEESTNERIDISEDNLYENRESISDLIIEDQDSIVSYTDFQAYKEESPPIYEFVKFSFTFDGFVLILSQNSHYNLAKFNFQLLTVSGNMLSNQSMTMSFLLNDCTLDDLRPDRISMLTRMVERKPIPMTSIDKSNNSQRMIDITYNSENKNTSVDIKVHSFTMIFAADFLQRIVVFFSIGLEKISRFSENFVKDIRKIQSNFNSIMEKSSVIINLHIDEPDIILVESLGATITDAIVLNFKGDIYMKTVESVCAKIRGKIENIELNFCPCFSNYRSELSSPIIEPFSLLLNGFLSENGKVFNAEADSTVINMFLNPVTVEILSKVYSTFYKMDDTLQFVSQSEIRSNYKNIWNVREFSSSEFWFLLSEVGIDVLDEAISNVINPFNIQQFCKFILPSVNVTMEIEQHSKRIPMVFLNFSINADVRNWTNNLEILAYIDLQVSYYNKMLGVWEYIIEPIEAIECGSFMRRSWNFMIKINKELNDSGRVVDYMSKTEQYKTNIHISSVNDLEIMISKTAYEVLKSLQIAFKTACEQNFRRSITDQKSVVIAPYKLINKIGYPVKVLVTDDKCSFIPYNETCTERILIDSDYVLQNDKELKLDLKDHFKYNTIGSICTRNEARSTKNRFLCLRIDEIDFNIEVLILKSGKKCFPVNVDVPENVVVIEITFIEYTINIVIRSIYKVINECRQPINLMLINGIISPNIVIPYGEIKYIELADVCTHSNFCLITNCGEYETNVIHWKSLQAPYVYHRKINFRSKKSSAPNHSINTFCHPEAGFLANTDKLLSYYCLDLYILPLVRFKNYLPYKVSVSLPDIMDSVWLNEGDSMDVYSLTTEPSVLTIQINETDKTVSLWRTQINLIEHFNEYQVFTFKHTELKNATPLNLIVRCDMDKGTLNLTLFSPFYIFNKTEHQLYIKAYNDSSKGVLIEENNSNIFSPYMNQNFASKKKVMISLDGANWSDKFHIDTVGSSGVINIKFENCIRQVVVQIEIGKNELTKQVIVMPYFIFINNTQFDLQYLELGCPDNEWYFIQKNSTKSFWSKSKETKKFLKIIISDFQRMSGNFCITETDTHIIKLNNKFGGLVVDVQVLEMANYIKFYLYKDGMASALLLNHTDLQLIYMEKESTINRFLGPNNCVLFNWEIDTSKRILVCQAVNGTEEFQFETDLKHDAVGEIPYKEIKYYWISFLNGLQRILLLTSDISILKELQVLRDLANIHTELTFHISGLGVSICDNIEQKDLLYAAIRSSDVIWEYVTSSSSTENRYRSFNARESADIEKYYQEYLMSLEKNLSENSIESTNVSSNTELQNRFNIDFEKNIMIKPRRRIIHRRLRNGLWVHLSLSANYMQIQVKINHLQIDNQMDDAYFPIVFAPMPLAKSMQSEDQMKPFIELFIAKKCIKESKVDQYKYFKVLIQEFTLKFDTDFLNLLVKFFDSPKTDTDNNMYLNKISEDNILRLSSLESEKKNFYDLLHLSPLKMHLSFRMGTESSGIIAKFFGSTLLDITNIQLKLGFFERTLMFANNDQLVKAIKDHYKSQFLRQFYVLAFGLDVIGNPYGMIVGLKKGVEALFYEPIHGAIQGPEEFAEGIYLGVRSLFGHTVGGAAEAVSKITGAFGRGLATLTFDEGYQRNRQRLLRNEPSNLSEQFIRGGRNLVFGVYDGFTGVLTQPISGAREHGIEGFYKGVGKGFVGLITRPIVGVADFTSDSLNIVKQYANRESSISKLRLSRQFDDDGILRPYDKYLTFGANILKEIDKGNYAHVDRYIFHIFLTTNKSMILLTDKHIFHIQYCRVFSTWKINWHYSWEEIDKNIKKDKSVVQLILVEPRNRLVPFMSKIIETKVIETGSDQKCDILFEKILRCLEKYAK